HACNRRTRPDEGSCGSWKRIAPARPSRCSKRLRTAHVLVPNASTLPFAIRTEPGHVFRLQYFKGNTEKEGSMIVEYRSREIRRSLSPGWRVLQQGCDLLQIVNKALQLVASGLVIECTQDRGGMYRCYDAVAVFALNDFATSLRDFEILTEQRLSRSRSEANDDSGFDSSNFSVKPGLAGGDLQAVGPLMNAALASRLPIEVLYDVSDINIRAIDAGIDKSLL